MAEPTYEELKARVAELERKKERAGNLEFRVSEKGGGQRLRTRSVPGDSLLRAVGAPAGCR
jgi:hypothetical protein